MRSLKSLSAAMDAKSARRKLSKSDLVLIGSVDGLPADLSARKKHYLRATAL